MASDGPAQTGTAGGTPINDELLFWLGDDADLVVPDRLITPAVSPTEEATSTSSVAAPSAPVPPVVEVPAPAVSSPEPARAVIASPARALNRRRRLVTLLGVVAAGAVVFGIYSSGKPAVPTFAGNAADQQSAAQQVDQTKVAALMKKISANAKDIASLQALADLYFQAGDYKTASSWEKKVLAIDPKNTQALLGLGASQFNLGNSKDAEKDWLQVVAIDPKKAEAHYDLGFLYLSATPPDMAKVKSEWQKVVAIDPKSDIAKTVAAHLKSLSNLPSAGTSGKK